MAKLIKLDLHTHPIEALRKEMGIKGISEITPEVAGVVVSAVKSAGLNGIAITGYSNFIQSWVACLQILDHFRQANLLVLPGTEIDFAGQSCLQIYVPPYIRRRVPFFREKEWFFILAHPGFAGPVDFESVSRIDFDAVEGKSLRGEFPAALQLSQDKKLPLIQSSDAQKLADIGRLFIEVEFR